MFLKWGMILFSHLCDSNGLFQHLTWFTVYCLTVICDMLYLRNYNIDWVPAWLSPLLWWNILDNCHIIININNNVCLSKSKWLCLVASVILLHLSQSSSFRFIINFVLIHFFFICMVLYTNVICKLRRNITPLANRGYRALK